MCLITLRKPMSGRNFRLDPLELTQLYNILKMSVTAPEQKKNAGKMRALPDKIKN